MYESGGWFAHQLRVAFHNKLILKHVDEAVVLVAVDKDGV